MKGIAPKDVTMGDIYRYSIPFCLIEVLALAICFFYPKIVLLIPNWM
jgi:TRAP-type mannitol/chloroaromatic compound transport system permease large subunit